MSCLNCQERHLGCQDPKKCEKYAAFLAERDRTRGKTSTQKQSDHEIRSYIWQSKDRYKRRKGRK